MLVGLLLTFAWRQYAAEATFGICRNCNVIVIGVDTLRADRVHALGYFRDTTPTIDALAGRGYVFSQAIAPASWTVPSFMSIFTGVYPSVHKVVNKYRVFTEETQILSNLETLSPNIQTLAQVLKNEGYATGGFTGDAGVSSKFGYGQGFDVYTDEKAFGGLENSENHALAWLDTQKENNFFMFFHGYDLHGQFPPPTQERYVDVTYTGSYTGTPKEEEILREEVLTPHGVELTSSDVSFWNAVYDNKVRSADEKLGAFLSKLSDRGMLSRTLIVVVSDHGEEFYEHGGFDHGHSLYDELIHVPLLFIVPGMTGGVTISSQVSTMDVMPTILHLLGIRQSQGIEAQLRGRKNLAEYFTNPAGPGSDVYSETDYRGYTHKRSIRTADGWKYIMTLESGAEELYNLNTDTKEKTNLIGVELEIAETLRVGLRQHLEQDLHTDLSNRPSISCLPVYQGECQQ